MQEISRHKRGVTVDDEDAVHTGPGQFGKGLPEGVSRAELLLLLREPESWDLSENRSDTFTAMTDHYDSAGGVQRGGGTDNTGNHRLSGNRLEHLRQIRMHALSLACRQNHDIHLFSSQETGRKPLPISFFWFNNPAVLRTS